MSDDLVGREVDVLCADESWHGTQPLRVAGFRRIADGATEDLSSSGPLGRVERIHVYRWPQVWLFDNEAQMGRSDLGPGRIPRWYVNPSARRVLTTVNNKGVRLVCPQCGHCRPLTWIKLTPLLDRIAVTPGVSSVTLQALATILR